jgi:hypothetical protein
MSILGPVGRFWLRLFLLIAEPRVIRLVMFTAYCCFAVLGTFYLLNLPPSFEGVLGTVVAVIFGGCLVAGGATGLIAVLPAMWWLERLGIVLLWTALAEFLIVAIGLGASTATVAIALAFALLLVNRWLSEADRHVRAAP